MHQESKTHSEGKNVSYDRLQTSQNKNMQEEKISILIVFYIFFRRKIQGLEPPANVLDLCHQIRCGGSNAGL